MQKPLLSDSKVGFLDSKITAGGEMPSFDRNLSIDYGTEEKASKPKKIKAACYCRVSSMTDMQEDSLENQTKYFTNYIRSNPNYHFVGVYSDRGKTGTKIDGRTGFSKLIRDCLEGKIDLVLCKSISRFARSVTDSLDTVRQLKEKGVRLIFEKENIDTEDMKSEFIMTLLSAVAQEESRSISENVTWSFAKRFAQGQANFIRILGYTRDENKNWLINETEAAVVREAFKECLNGKNPSKIAKSFIKKGYKKANGRTDWSALAVRSILKNERYTGDVLCQKTYTEDYLSHKGIKNDGAKNQYLIEDHHPPIIDRKTFQRAQEELLKRSHNKKANNKRKITYPLSKRLKCENCGSNLQRYYCKGVVTWRCGKSVKSKSLCNLQGIKEGPIKKAIIEAFTKKYKLGSASKVNQKVVDLIKELEKITPSADFEYNQLKIDLQRILFEENMALINGENEDKLAKLEFKRKSLEQKIEDKERWWDLVEGDYNYRKKALKTLKDLLAMKRPFKRLKEASDDVEFLRAWVLNVKVISPTLFKINWITGNQTEIKLKGD
ncbi:recombinase family protein [Proteinivorax tanatarense]|uniref:Recombinase family protein n=1 Tax=Proteinivorax tanatarense TaxID=1260629 RepID=A0AAU7VHH2_9FIRM